MPPVKSSPSKRGAPKAKGAIRAKSGCYTCRIRRKKCDEQPDESGRCSTCIRLRLECLGFGAKRPEWLRETNNVNELREKIKHFLAAQGMIKGHSTSSSRAAEQEQPTLRLAEENSDSSATPPTPTLSLTSDTIRHAHNTSSIRDDPNWNMDAGYAQSSSLFANAMRDNSPFSSQGSSHDPTFQLPTAAVDTSNSFSPALRSSFSPLYSATFDDFTISFGPSEIMNYIHRSRMPCIGQFLDEMLQHYIDHVVSLQYMFTDDNVRRLICDTASSHGRSREAASLLASVHWKRFSFPHLIAFENEEIKSRLQELWSLLATQDLASGDAMAALHVVSSYLFDGGVGQWEEWLNLSYQYVDDLFRKAGDPSEALLKCDAKDAFIIKTSLWFDVLASVTTRKSPHFLLAIRSMFDPAKPRIYEVSSETQTSMMSPMGCHNEVVWALAEISQLAYWKEVQIQNGCLSMPMLVKQGMVIDDYLAPPAGIYVSTNMDGCRVLASEIFRASARLYLRTVMSGDHPDVLEIKESVQDTIDCMKRLNFPPAQEEVNGQTMSRSVVRNTVFSFFICGAFAETEEHRAVIKTLLDREGNGAGNCGSIYNLLQRLWASKDQTRQARHSKSTLNPEPVDWRGQLSEWKILLV